MKNIAKFWFAGTMILIPAVLFRALDHFFLFVESEFITGYRPIWWRIISIAILLTSYVLIPLFALSNAKRILSDLSKPKEVIDHYSIVIKEMKNEKRA